MEALVIIDIQQWFFRTQERLQKLPKLLEQVNILAHAAAMVGRPVILVRTVHARDKSTWTLAMRRANTAVLIDGTPDMKDVDGLELPVVMTTVTKTRHSAFIRTEFERTLREAGVTSLLLAGAFIDKCVGLTAIEAVERDFSVRIAREAAVSANEAQGEAMLRFINTEFGVKAVSTSDLLRELDLNP